MRVGVDVGVKVRVSVCVRVGVAVAFEIKNSRTTSGAAPYVTPPVMPPGCEILIEHLPVPMTVSLVPKTVHTSGVVLVKVTGRPDEDVPGKVISSPL
jgi:hypothetical protein